MIIKNMPKWMWFAYESIYKLHTSAAAEGI